MYWLRFKCSLMDSNFILFNPFTNQETLSAFRRWLCQLEYIFEYNEPLLIPALINHPYQFNQLVSLSVSYDIDSEEKAFTSWFHHLSNAPALKILKLTNSRVECSGIEVLHTNATLITALELAQIDSLLTGNLDSRLPKPPMVEALSIKNCLNFSFQPKSIGYRGENVPEEPALNTIVALEDQIQSFRTDLKIQGYHELEELNRKNIHLNNLQFTLDRSSDFRFKGDELIRLCDVFKHLHTLVISYFDPEIFEIAKEFTNLKQLTLRIPYSLRMAKISLGIIRGR